MGEEWDLILPRSRPLSRSLFSRWPVKASQLLSLLHGSLKILSLALAGTEEDS